MTVLSPTTSPPATPFARTHTPAEASLKNHRVYRSCLRWEFGFRCAFCLLHERDIVLFGVDGLGVFWIEHFILKSDKTYPESERRSYENCFYCCAWCNQSRGTKPHTGKDNNALLNPCQDAWGAHYELADDHFIYDGDPRAKITDRAYDLNDERKVGARRTRRETIRANLATIADGPNEVDQLLAFAGRKELAADAKAAFTAAADKQRESVRNAYRTLQQYNPIPSDAPTTCRCRHRLHMPRNMEHASQALPTPTGPDG